MVRSRVLIGVGAWLLGAAAATTGSLYAVNQLGQGLLAQHTKQVTAAMVNAQLALESPERTGPSPSPSASPSHQASGHSAAPKATTSAGRLLTSAAGTAMAACKPGGAYLIYWSPQQGYEADHVNHGPSQVASVTFRGSSGGVVMNVTCSGGHPVKHLSAFQWAGGGDS